MANKVNFNLQMSVSNLSSSADQDYDDLDFSSGDEFELPIHHINSSHQFSNKLQCDKGNVRIEDKPFLSQYWNESKMNDEDIINSFSSRNRSDIWSKAVDFSELWGEQLDWELNHKSWSQSEDIFLDDGSYNKYVIIWQKNSEDPLVTIVEESWESDESF